jgi:hypothetical protein
MVNNYPTGIQDGIAGSPRLCRGLYKYTTIVRQNSGQSRWLKPLLPNPSQLSNLHFPLLLSFTLGGS